MEYRDQKYRRVLPCLVSPVLHYVLRNEKFLQGHGISVWLEVQVHSLKAVDEMPVNVGWPMLSPLPFRLHFPTPEVLHPFISQNQKQYKVDSRHHRKYTRKSRNLT